MRTGASSPAARPWNGLAEVVESRAVGSLYHKLVLAGPELAGSARPGQFLHILCPPGDSAAGLSPGLPFLRRPLSLHDADPAAGTVSLLFRLRGPGTRSLAGIGAGARLAVLGPLGNGFPAPAAGRPALVVGGGIGLAPLFFLARTLAGNPALSASAGGRPVAILAGVAGAGDLGLVEPFRNLAASGAELEVSTEEGLPGTTPGMVTVPLERRLAAASLKNGLGVVPAIYACGPRPMLAAVRDLARRAGAPAWFSLEERMACGVGACRGCAVRAAGRGSGPYRLVCRDGPVFAAEDIDWREPRSRTPATGEGGVSG